MAEGLAANIWYALLLHVRRQRSERLAVVVDEELVGTLRTTALPLETTVGPFRVICLQPLCNEYGFRDE